MNIHIMPGYETSWIFGFAALGIQVNLNWCKNQHCVYNFESTETRAEDLGQQ